MSVVSTNFVSHFFSLSWLTGPIFDKELRISSRLRRNYLIRSAYVMLLTLTVVSAWLSLMMSGGGTSLAFKISRSAEIGKGVILAITWFQFLAGQLVAVIMLSNSISDEIRRGTLDVLMTTAINSFQIVVGKVLSKLLQLILLLAVSLPLLAVVRVFGGMSWEYVVSSVCITFTAMLFAGSLSLFLSIWIRRPYVIILIILVVLVLAYGLSAYQAQIAVATGSAMGGAMVLVNPVAVMMATSIPAFTGAGGATISWPVHCLIMLVGSLVVLAAAVVRTRRGALAVSSGVSEGRLSSMLRPIRDQIVLGRGRHAPSGLVRPVEGSPLVWKELGRPLSASVGANAVVFIVFSLALLLACGLSRGVLTTAGGVSAYHVFVLGLWALASIRTAAMAAVSVAKEKEARTWPILMSTTLDDRQIMRAKALVVLWRNAPAWVVLALSPAVFYSFIKSPGRAVTAFWSPSFLWDGLIDPVATVVFLIGTGLYLSVRLRSATSAVVATLGCTLAIWVTQRFVFSVMIAVAARGAWIMQGPWLLCRLLSLVFYLGAGLSLFRRARRQLRHHIF
ncbi:MAG: ABC transporter permease subunit [Planctomycetota bacterium]|jgi:ABC-type transport system involved in multi-copper enzyme maturation permease subunit